MEQVKAEVALTHPLVPVELARVAAVLAQPELVALGLRRFPAHSKWTQ
jgi:hypothetical protein